MVEKKANFQLADTINKTKDLYIFIPMEVCQHLVYWGGKLMVCHERRIQGKTCGLKLIPKNRYRRKLFFSWLTGSIRLRTFTSLVSKKCDSTLHNGLDIIRGKRYFQQNIQVILFKVVSINMNVNTNSLFVQITSQILNTKM